MKSLTSALKKMLNGLACADAGEYLTPRQKTSFLTSSDYNVTNATDPAPVLSDTATITTPRRRVAMYMGSELPAAMMSYMIETCESLRHDLTILTFETETISNLLLTPYKEELEEKGINMKVAKLSGEPIPHLARYLRSHPEIAFMTCKDSGYLGRCYLNDTHTKNALPVPVVVVVTNPSANTEKPVEQTQEVAKAGAAQA